MEEMGSKEEREKMKQQTHDVSTCNLICKKLLHFVTDILNNLYSYLCSW
jgi:hypothetical protein